MILLLDNRDSFSWNVADLIAQIAPPGVEVRVERSDEIAVDEVRALGADLIVISPGPGGPRDAGVSCEVLRDIGQQGDTPIFGVCLGMQCIGEVFGGEVGRAPELVHGEASPIVHDGAGAFRGIPSPFPAARYHSLAVREDSLPDTLEVTARTPEGIVMGIRHRTLPIEGVQFHPESILTEHGRELLTNALTMIHAGASA